MQSIHPFPARMAPEIALAECASLEGNSIILDPMVGSGTVVRVASEYGHRGIGFDLDPLAVLITRVWTTPIDTHELKKASSVIIERARDLELSSIRLPWIDNNPETREFIDYWFGEEQRSDLRRLSSALAETDGPIGDALRIALSRIIITKDNGASLARDVSHSRPHRVRDKTTYLVLDEFSRSVERLIRRLQNQPPVGNVWAELGDVRKLEKIKAESVDAVITSPPYLNAIDYLRGHRLSLVWLGYSVKDIRTIRSTSVGAERAPSANSDTAIIDQYANSLSNINQLPRREKRIFDRYILDLLPMISEIHRVIRSKGKAVFVIGNSCLRGIFIENAAVIDTMAREMGFDLLSRRDRNLLPARRYLPPPSNLTVSDFNKRMRTETILTYVRP
jgi:hypothetical protein